MKKTSIFEGVVFMMCMMLGCVPTVFATDELLHNAQSQKAYPFGVYLGNDADVLYRLVSFEKVVLIAENFSTAEIFRLQSTGTKVLGYVSLSTITQDDPLYARFSRKILDNVPHEADEKYVRVSSRAWRAAVFNDRIAVSMEKGVDGVYFAHGEVYARSNNKESTAESLYKILKKTHKTYRHAEVIVENGFNLVQSDVFTERGYKKYIDGFSKQSVSYKPDFSAIDDGQDTYIAQTRVKRKKAITALKRYKKKGFDVYAIDFTNNADQYMTARSTYDTKGFNSFFGTRDLDTVLWYGGLDSSVAGRPFAEDSVWNAPIASSAQIDPHSDDMIATMYDGKSFNKIYINVDEWTIPLYYSDSSTPMVSVSCENCGPGFLNNIRMPESAEADPKSDGTISIIDLDQKRSYELFQATKLADGNWAATSGFSFDLTGSGIQTISSTSTSPRGAGVSVTGGIIRRDEILQGVIPHALAMAYDYPKAGYFVYPASAEDGRSEEEYALPEGAHVQLNPDLDLDSLELSRSGKIIAKALQEYGAYILDNADGIAIYAEGRYAKDVQWDGLLTSEDVTNIPLSQLRVLELGEHLTNPYLE